jgi:acyl carrier protein
MTETLIKAFIQKEFLRHQTLDLDIADNLIEQGIIDSLGIMRLLTFLERSFGVKVSDEELIPVNFETIENISSFIRGKESKNVGKETNNPHLGTKQTAHRQHKSEDQSCSLQP